MNQLFPIIVVAVVLVGERGLGGASAAEVAAEAASHPRPGLAVVLALAPVVALVLAAMGGIHWCGRVLRRNGSPRPIILADRIVSVCRWLLLANHVAVVLFAGWLAAIRKVTGDIVLVDEVIAILPPIVGALGLWWVHYPIERRLREALLVRRLDEGRSVHPVPSRGVYVMEQARMHILLLLAPILLILALSDIAQRMLAAAPSLPPWSADAATLAAGVLVFTIAPLLARAVLNVESLGAGPIRDDLDGICRRHGVRVRDFLLWRTGGVMINAAVMGLAGRLRYVLLTDALLETLRRDEVRAVMAHEVGHVRRHHMPWLVVSLLSLLFGLGALVSVPLLGLLFAGVEASNPIVFWVDGGATLVTAVAALVAFGWISRRYERQADTFAVQHLSGLHAEVPTEPVSGPPTDAVPYPPTDPASGPTITEEAVDAMRRALEGVARLSSVDMNRRSWRHGSITWRRDYLTSLIGRPVDSLPIDRLVRRLKVAAAATLAGSVALLAGVDVVATSIIDDAPAAPPAAIVAAEDDAS